MAMAYGTGVQEACRWTHIHKLNVCFKTNQKKEEYVQHDQWHRMKKLAFLR